MIDIPYDYFSNLSSYEEFVIKTNLLGLDITAPIILNMVARNGFIMTSDGIVFIDDRGEPYKPKRFDYLDVAQMGVTALKNIPPVITGRFDCSDNQLADLEGSPTCVIGDFICVHNNLTSLKHCPVKIKGNLYCSHNKLESLEGCPKKINGSFCCSHNNLTSLKGCPTEVKRDFFCSHNKLESLEGCPARVGKIFDCSHNSLTDLKGCPVEVETFIISYNPLRTLKGAPSKAGQIWSDGCKHLSCKQITDYYNFLERPSRDLMDETGHYCPKVVDIQSQMLYTIGELRKGIMK